MWISQGGKLTEAFLFTMCLLFCRTVEVQNKLTRIALVSNQLQYFDPNNECSLASTSFYFGLVCDYDRITIYPSQNLQIYTQDWNLTSTFSTVPYYMQKPIWAFSDEFIFQAGDLRDEYFRFYNPPSFNIVKHYGYYSGRQRPLLISAHDSRFVFIFQDQQTFQYNLTMHYFSYQTYKVVQNLTQYSFETQPSSLLIKTLNSVFNLYIAYPTQSGTVIRVDQATSYVYQNVAYISTPSQNCAMVLAASAKYLVVGCPENSVITVYNNTSYQEVCSVSASSGTVFAETLALYQHTDYTGTDSNLATIFVNAFVPQSSLHYITQILISPRQGGQCYLYNQTQDYLVSHTITSSFSPSQLEVALSQNLLLVNLKTPGQVYYNYHRALYKSQINSLYSTSSQTCADKHYSPSVLNSGSCSSCTTNIDPITDPAVALIQESICCNSDSQFGPLCLGCAEYQASLGHTLPQNSEWIISGGTCTSECKSGYSLFPATGLCESSSYLNSVNQDSCYNPSTCQKCNSQSCYFNGASSCSTGSTDRIQAFRFINSQCGRDASFCGAQEHTIDLSNEQSSFTISSQGENGLKGKKGVLCQWTIRLTNLPSNLKYSLTSQIPSIQSATVSGLNEFQSSNTLAESFIINSNGSISIMSNNEARSFSTSISQDVSFNLGLLFYNDSNLDSVIILTTISGQGNQNEQGADYPRADVTVVIVINVLIFCICGVLLIIYLCYVWRKQRIRSQQERRSIETQNASRLNLYQDQTDGVGECAMCLAELTHEFIKTDCKHYFHKQCLTKWLRSHSNCPCCGTELNQ